jgi:hypothetical protein
MLTCVRGLNGTHCLDLVNSLDSLMSGLLNYDLMDQDAAISKGGQCDCRSNSYNSA